MSWPRAAAALAVALTGAACAACAADPAAAPAPYRAPLCAGAPDLCAGDPVDAPSLSPPVIVAPSPAMPPEVVSQLAHNNLGVEVHAGRLFLAFRTAPNHFASPDTVLYVVSTDDLATWRFEGAFNRGTDLREPQLLSLNGQLFFYWSVLGRDPLSFTPQGVEVVRWLAPGAWTEPAPVFEPGFLAWRIRADGDRATAFGYHGGENIYAADGDPITVSWLASDDGLTWLPRVPDRPVVLTGGASETDAAVLGDGTVIAVARNEAGDADGFGSKVCRGEASAPAAWTCAHDPRKYDSPLVIRQGDAVYLIARRNLTDTGHYDLGDEGAPMAERYLANQLDYWQRPKRCSLWRVDPDALRVDWLLDLPSRGDTCFAEAVRLTDSRWLLFNYTSPLDGDDDPMWAAGQVGPTVIYHAVLALPAP